MSEKKTVERVVIESPYNGTDEEIGRNVSYAISALRDCLERGEAPLAFHLLYTRDPRGEFVSDDSINSVSVGRDAAIEASLAWAKKADKIVVYDDLGITRGMKEGIKRALRDGTRLEWRSLKKEKGEKYQG